MPTTPDGAAVVAERNQPNPDIAMFRMRVDQDFVAVEFWAGDVVVDMREVGLARRQLGRAFQVQKAGQDATVTAGI